MMNRLLVHAYLRPIFVTSHDHSISLICLILIVVVASTHYHLTSVLSRRLMCALLSIINHIRRLLLIERVLANCHVVGGTVRLRGRYLV